MEIESLKYLLQELQEKGMDIGVLVTDRSSTVRYLGYFNMCVNATLVHTFMFIKKTHLFSTGK